jgi:hypothetical protein
MRAGSLSPNLRCSGLLFFTTSPGAVERLARATSLWPRSALCSYKGIAQHQIITANGALTENLHSSIVAKNNMEA